jgi:serine/threonine-protein kinase
MRWLSEAAVRIKKAVRLPRIERLGRFPGLRHVRRFPGGKAAFLWLGGAVGAFGLGYLVAALVLFPAPIFAATIDVPQLIGLTQNEAEEAVGQAGLIVGEVRSESHPTAARGDVFWQDPPPGIGVQRGHSIHLTVSGGPQRIPVPDLTGYDAAVAEQLILAGGLIVGRREMTQAPAPRGVVINTRPPTGTTLLPGTEVTLVVSLGAPTITVPDLEGLTREEADSVLVDAGLSLGTAVRRTTRDWPPGTVMAQTPAPGTLSAPGTAVNITLARERNP